MTDTPTQPTRSLPPDERGADRTAATGAAGKAPLERTSPVPSSVEPAAVSEPGNPTVEPEHPTPAHDCQAEADAALTALIQQLGPEESALALTVLANRAATRLHNLARGEAGARKGQPDWSNWAALQNASRNLVLAASTCRDLAAKSAGRRR